MVLTREPPDNDGLVRDLASLGIETKEYPCIETAFIAAGPETPSLIDGSDVIAFTSRRGVLAVGGAVRRIRSGPGLIAAVGPATAAAVEHQLKRPADLVPADANARALADAIITWAERDGKACRVLHVRGTRTTGDFSGTLEAAGHTVIEWIAYETRIRPVEALTERRPSIIVLASPSAVDGFFAGNRGGEPWFRYVAIGPSTGRRLAERGIDHYHEAGRATPQGLLEAIRSALEEEQE